MAFPFSFLIFLAPTVNNTFRALFTAQEKIRVPSYLILSQLSRQLHIIRLRNFYILALERLTADMSNN